jgi:hypothetical protein
MPLPVIRLSRVRSAGLASAALVAVAALGAARLDAPETGAFIVTIGHDTLAEESYTRTDTVLQGTSALRVDKGTVVRYYTLTLDKTGNLAKYEVVIYPAGVELGSQHPLLHVILTPMGGAMHEVYHTDAEHTLHLAKAGPATLPFMHLGFGVWETVVMRAVRSGKDSTGVPQIFMQDTMVYLTAVKRMGKDSVSINSEYGMAKAKVDAQGHILGYDAPGSTTQVVVSRVPSVDVKAFAMATSQKPIGRLSPTDTVHAAAGAAKMTLIYSRPSMRGRVVFGNNPGAIVPWNVVWRTGANAATTFITDKDLMVGGTLVPAGTYTLFSVPNPTGWKLIISKKTGEWGTEYDPTMDLARVDMTVAALPAPMEQLAITFVPQGAGAMFTVSWEKTAASVMMQAK